MTYFVNFRYLNDHLFGKELFILFAASAFRKLSSIYVFINDSSHHGSLNIFRGSPSVNVDRSQSNVGTESSFQADSTGSVGQPSSVDSIRNQSEESVPRRSSRNKQAPQRYGERVLNQTFVDQPDDREYFV